MSRIAVYPGSFDPITNGHLDILARAAAVFDDIVVGVLANSGKAPLLPVDRRIAVIGEALAEAGQPAERFTIVAFDGLTVELCRAHGATAIVRGLRGVRDFESEMQLAHNNRILAPEIETVFLMASPSHVSISSSLVKEIAALGGDIGSLVPPSSARALAAAIRGH